MPAPAPPADGPTPALAPDPVGLLNRQHESLVARWVGMLQGLPHSNYSRRPMEELRSTCSECLRAYEALLGEGNTEPLWQFVERICCLRAAQQFPPSEITEAFMLFLEVAEDVLGPEIADRQEWAALMRELRRCTRRSLKAWVNAYMLHLELT